MRKFGFKFFSTNFEKYSSTIKECVEFATSKEDIFIELSTINNTPKEEYLRIKQQLDGLEVRIHASYIGFDAGNREMEKQNREVLAKAQYAADVLNSKSIVVHAGYGHTQKQLEEAGRQFKLFNDKRIVVENLPYFDNNGDELLVHSAEDVAYMMNESGCGFCFDFSHAKCSAVALNADLEKYLQDLFKLKPSVYHMCDGDIKSLQDTHLHFGEGNFPLEHYLNTYTDKNAYITMETGNGFEQQNDLRIKDYEYLKAKQKA